MINFPVSDWMPDAKIPSGPIQDKWSKYKLESKLINPNNKRKYTVLVVGSAWLAPPLPPRLPNLATTSNASATRTAPAAPTPLRPRAALTQPRTTRTTATPFTACFTTPLKAATSAPVKPMSTVWRKSPPTSLTSVAQGVPFGREYGGLLDNRSFGGAQLKRTFYARGQTGQQLLLGAYQALKRKWPRDTLKCSPAMK